MSKPRLQLRAVIDTGVHADTIITAIRAELVGKDIFKELVVGRALDELQRVVLKVDILFNSRIDRNKVTAWLDKQANGNLSTVKTWILSVKAFSHTCTHDDPVILPCDTTEYVMEFER